MDVCAIEGLCLSAGAGGWGCGGLWAPPQHFPDPIFLPHHHPPYPNRYYPILPLSPLVHFPTSIVLPPSYPNQYISQLHQLILRPSPCTFASNWLGLKCVVHMSNGARFKAILDIAPDCLRLQCCRHFKSSQLHCSSFSRQPAFCEPGPSKVNIVSQSLTWHIVWHVWCVEMWHFAPICEVGGDREETEGKCRSVIERSQDFARSKH